MASPRPLLFTLFILPACVAPQVLVAQPALNARPIAITREMVLNEVAAGDAFALFDEPGQETPSKSWTTGWGMSYHPLRAWVDLGRPYKLSKISLYDSNGTGKVIVSTGLPFEWDAAFTDSLAKYNTWSEHSVDAETQFVRIEIADAGGVMPEVRIFGSPSGKPSITPQVLGAARARPVARVVPPTMDKFIGTNGFIDDPIEVLAVGGWVREYHSWAWDEGDGRDGYAGYPNNQNQFSPAAGGGGGWFFDDYYAKLKAAGVDPAPVMQGSVKWLGGDESKNDRRPHAVGADPEDPRSYAAHADHMFQFAARYGASRVADSLLKLAPNQPRRSGLGLVKYFENWNEADRWWAGRESYFSPYELAAMSSADRDGHMGIMGKTFGVRNADPSAKLVMTGLAGLKMDYIRAVKAWSDWNRPDLKAVNGGFVCDAINLHHYVTNGADQTEGTIGVAPEAGKLQERLREFVDYRDKYLPGVEVWLTEFGYDTNPASPYRAPSIGANSHEEVQGQWLVRSYLELAASGIDRAAMFMSRDVDPKSTEKFSTSGLVTQKGEWKPKPSWFYLSTLRSRLQGMSFQNEMDLKRADIKASLFQNARTKARALAVWCPTSEAKVVAKYLLALPAGTKQAVLVEMKSGQKNGVEKPLAIRNGAVEVSVSERPILVLCS